MLVAGNVRNMMQDGLDGFGEAVGGNRVLRGLPPVPASALQVSPRCGISKIGHRIDNLFLKSRENLKSIHQRNIPTVSVFSRVFLPIHGVIGVPSYFFAPM